MPGAKVKTEPEVPIRYSWFYFYVQVYSLKMENAKAEYEKEFQHEELPKEKIKQQEEINTQLEIRVLKAASQTETPIHSQMGASEFMVQDVRRQTMGTGKSHIVLCLIPDTSHG